MWSIYTLQNLCWDAWSKVRLASTHKVLTLLTSAAIEKEQHEERIADAVALMNICTEPGSLMHIMNCKVIAATLVHLVHSLRMSEVRMMIACDALVTIAMLPNLIEEFWGLLYVTS